ncbi:MAG: uroporphyrinogen-III synthase [Acidimicrobiales bacterium]|nr:uroporphyrinogen-III synthase [Acidimicrobiales bacterium]
MEVTRQLAGRTIGITADRRSEDQAVMFRRLGAEVIVGPTIATTKVPDPALLRERSEEIAAEPPDYLIADTGIGIRTWMASVREWGLTDRVTTSLAASQIAVRGPKAAAALTSAGLPIWWRSSNEQLGELVEHLIAEGISGKRIAFQLHGDDSAEVVGRLEEAGATVITIPVYVWTDPADPEPAFGLIRRCCQGEVDAVTFTAGPQIRGLMTLSARLGQQQPLLEAFNSGTTQAACVGPVCAASAAAEGISNPLIPDHWRLGSLVKAVADSLG